MEDTEGKSAFPSPSISKFILTNLQPCFPPSKYSLFRGRGGEVGSDDLESVIPPSSPATIIFYKPGSRSSQIDSNVSGTSIKSKLSTCDLRVECFKSDQKLDSGQEEEGERVTYLRAEAERVGG